MQAMHDCSQMLQLLAVGVLDKHSRNPRCTSAVRPATCSLPLLLLPLLLLTEVCIWAKVPVMVEPLAA
jgi:hypothetical protein